MKKIIVTIVVLVLILIGVSYFLSNSVEAPSQDVNTAVDEVPATGVSFAISQEESSVEFNIMEVLRGKDFLVKGSTKDVAGNISINTADITKSEIGVIKINARTLKTDSTQRDGAITKFILKSDQPENEFIEFKTKQIAVTGTSTLKITGDLTVSGITKEVVFDASVATPSADKITVSAKAQIKRSDFNLVIPNLSFVANVPDTFDLIANLTLNRSAN